MDFKVFSKNGEILPINQATVPLSSLEYAYGFGVYETIRVKDGQPLFLTDHGARLMRSAEIIALAHPFSREKIIEFGETLIRQIGPSTYNLKILLIGAVNSDNATLYMTGSNPFFPDKKLYREGVFLTVAEYERVYPQAKTLNMLQSYMAYRQAREQDAYDALLISRDGFITEGTRTNFVANKDKVLYTAPEAEILPGVTRKHVLALARLAGYEVREAHIRLPDLENYDGAFITSTSTKILPVRRIGDFTYATIPESIRELSHLFDQLCDVSPGN